MKIKKSPSGFRRVSVRILSDEPCMPSFSYGSGEADGIYLYIKGFIEDPDVSPGGEYLYGRDGSEFAGREVLLIFQEQGNDRIPWSRLLKEKNHTKFGGLPAPIGNGRFFKNLQCSSAPELAGRFSVRLPPIQFQQLFSLSTLHNGHTPFKTQHFDYNILVNEENLQPELKQGIQGWDVDETLGFSAEVRHIDAKTLATFGIMSFECGWTNHPPYRRK